jgi:hypothetical protein
MRNIAAILCLALLLPACLTEQIWGWASDSYPVNPEPVAAGFDSDKVLTILVATDGETSPSFSLRVPSDWRSKTEVSIGLSGASVHKPILLSPRPLPMGGQGSLTPSEEAWFLRHDIENGSVDVLIAQEGSYLTVGTAQLPSERHWERITLAALMTPVTIAVDAITFITATLFFSWLESPFTTDEHDHSEHSSESESSSDQPEGFIFPAKAP